jgi:peptide/nickel transport system substrate-binding protein/oligopeptide transport system substrate-binding protein
LVALALVGVACDGSENTRARGPEATAPGGTANPEESPSPSPDEAPESPGAGPSAEEVFDPSDVVLRVAIRDPKTLDPMLIGDPGSTLVARQLYEGLTTWNPSTDEVEPSAAESWKVKKGGALWEFKLRDGMTFHDGTPVTAGDFRFAFDRIAQRDNASDLAYVLARVQGFEQVNQAGRSDHLAGIRAPNDRTLIVELTEPDRDFDAVLTHPGLVPLPAPAVKKLDDFLARPVGNGSFRMAAGWEAGEEILLEAFPDAVAPPEVDGIRFAPYPEAAASYLDFLEDELDVAEVPLGQLQGAGDEYGRQGYGPLLNTYSYGLNLRGKLLRSKKARVAINRAVGRESIANIVYKGILEAPRGLLPPSMPGFTKDVCKQLCVKSEDAARRALRSVKGPKRVEIDYPKEKPHDEVAESIAKDLRAVGFKVKLNEYKLNDFLTALQDGDQKMYRLTWITEYPSPDAYLSALFETGSPDNDLNYSNKKVDDLLAKARSQAKANKRTKLYQRAEKLILADAPIVPIGFFTMHWAAQPRVVGLELDATGGFDAAGISLAESGSIEEGEGE